MKLKNKKFSIFNKNNFFLILNPLVGRTRVPVFVLLILFFFSLFLGQAMATPELPPLIRIFTVTPENVTPPGSPVIVSWEVENLEDMGLKPCSLKVGPRIWLAIPAEGSVIRFLRFDTIFVLRCANRYGEVTRTMAAHAGYAPEIKEFSVSPSYVIYEVSPDLPGLLTPALLKLEVENMEDMGELPCTIEARPAIWVLRPLQSHIFPAPAIGELPLGPPFCTILTLRCANEFGEATARLSLPVIRHKPVINIFSDPPIVSPPGSPTTIHLSVTGMYKQWHEQWRDLGDGVEHTCTISVPYFFPPPPAPRLPGWFQERSIPLTIEGDSIGMGSVEVEVYKGTAFEITCSNIFGSTTRTFLLPVKTPRPTLLTFVDPPIASSPSEIIAFTWEAKNVDDLFRDGLPCELRFRAVPDEPWYRPLPSSGTIHFPWSEFRGTFILYCRTPVDDFFGYGLGIYQRVYFPLDVPRVEITAEVLGIRFVEGWQHFWDISLSWHAVNADFCIIRGYKMAPQGAMVVRLSYSPGARRGVISISCWGGWREHHRYFLSFILRRF